jgi:hypothetical protein
MLQMNSHSAQSENGLYELPVLKSLLDSFCGVILSVIPLEKKLDLNLQKYQNIQNV